MFNHARDSSSPAQLIAPGYGGAAWREDLSSYAYALVTALGAHPHAVPLLLSRPAMTPRNLRTMEAVVGMLHEAGFPLPRTLDILYSLTSFHRRARRGAGGPGRRGRQHRHGGSGRVPAAGRRSPAGG
ncbi:TetR/AcrR family transcriptional regulator C-terminal domain-containing protein [Streptomyces atroolivaceus]|uniref:TetR/AcrR family transcriptional regulator C-terminal domain-containing protein n=1 Tax=Streptomyces atroolivaceus TaxID=66869 RepID=UPI00379CD660